MIKVVKKMFKMCLFSYPSLDTASIKFVLNLIPKKLKTIMTPFSGRMSFLNKLRTKIISEVRRI